MIQSTSSPSRMRPVSSAKIERSASPSNATPSAAPDSRVARAIPSGWSAPQREVDVAAVGRVVDRRHAGARALEGARADLERGAVAERRSAPETRRGSPGTLAFRRET